MNTESLAARVATARALVEECVRDGDDDLSASDQAHLQETLEFLEEVGAALSAAGGDDEDAAPAAGYELETELGADLVDAAEPTAEDPAADDPSADERGAGEPGEGILESHDEAGVIFEDDDPDNENAWIAAAPDSIESLQDRC